MKKKIPIIILIILIIFLIALTIYKFTNKVLIMDVTPSIPFTTYSIDSNVKDNTGAYDSGIFNQLLIYQTEYTGYIENGENKLNFTAFISTNKTLSLYDNDNDTSKKFSNVKFNTIYFPDENNHEYVYFYTFDDSGNVYVVELHSLDVKETTITKVETNLNIIGLMKLVDGTDTYSKYNERLFVEDEENHVYDLLLNNMYADNFVNINNYYSLYDDGTVTNNMNYLVTDEKGNNIQPIIFVTIEDCSSLKNNPKALLITSDYDIIYSHNNTVYKLKSKLGNAFYDTNGYLYLCLVDGTKIEINGDIYTTGAYNSIEEN